MAGNGTKTFLTASTPFLSGGEILSTLFLFLVDCLVFGGEILEAKYPLRFGRFYKKEKTRSNNLIIELVNTYNSKIPIMTAIQKLRIGGASFFALITLSYHFPKHFMSDKSEIPKKLDLCEILRFDGVNTGFWRRLAGSKFTGIIWTRCYRYGTANSEKFLNWKVKVKFEMRFVLTCFVFGFCWSHWRIWGDFPRRHFLLSQILRFCGILLVLVVIFLLFLSVRKIQKIMLSNVEYWGWKFLNEI